MRTGTGTTVALSVPICRFMFRSLEPCQREREHDSRAVEYSEAPRSSSSETTSLLSRAMRVTRALVAIRRSAW